MLFRSDPDDHAPVLHSRLASVDAVIEEMSEIVAKMPEDMIMPREPAGFPPPGEAPDKLIWLGERSCRRGRRGPL